MVRLYYISGLHDALASVQVPLNYSEPHGDSAVVALARYPSAVGSDSKKYRGPILFNPGGPGGSGVDLVESAGGLLASIVGPEFDVVSFDPRGICPHLPSNTDS